MLTDPSNVDVPYAFRRFINEASSLLSGFENFIGIPVLPILMSPYRFIDSSVVNAFYTAVRGLSDVNDLAVILNSIGGDVDEAYLLARYLQGIVKGRLIVYVPRLAKCCSIHCISR